MDYYIWPLMICVSIGPNIPGHPYIGGHNPGTPIILQDGYNPP